MKNQNPHHWHDCTDADCEHRTCCLENCPVDPTLSSRRRMGAPTPCAKHRPPRPGPTGERPDVETILARANAASPGPWIYRAERWNHDEIHYAWMTLDTQPEHPHAQRTMGLFFGTLGRLRDFKDPIEESYDPDAIHNRQTTADAEFVSESRTDIPALVAYVKRLEGERQTLLARLETEATNLRQGLELGPADEEQQRQYQLHLIECLLSLVRTV